KFVGDRCVESKPIRTTHSDRSGRAKEYLSSDVRLACRLFTDGTVRESDRKNDQQNADGDTENTDRGARRPMQHIRKDQTIHFILRAPNYSYSLPPGFANRQAFLPAVSIRTAGADRRQNRSGSPY